LTRIDQDFTISMANPKFEELTGYRRADIEGRMRWIDFITRDDRERVKQYHYARRSGGGQAPPEYECRIPFMTRTRHASVTLPAASKKRIRPFCRPSLAFSCWWGWWRSISGIFCRFINPAMNCPKIVIPAKAGIFFITNRVGKEIPSCDGMTWVCL
jgi:PAS domain S-box-containing protein